MYFKPDWEDAKKRFEALWHQELVDRCCISVFAPKAGHEEEFRKGTCIYSTLHAFEPEEVLAEQERYFSHCFFGGESLPDLWLNYGAAGHAGYFDPPQGYNHGSFWIGKKIYDYEKDKLVFDPNNAIMRKQEEMASFIAKHCKDRYLISTPDNSGQLDALSLLRGANDLLLDFYDDPEYVHESLDELYKAWDYSLQRLYDICKDCNYGGSEIGWLSVWAPGRMSQLQSDISVMLSNDIFREFELPELIRCASRQDYNLYHLDGAEQLRHLDDILAIDNIQMIQWVSVAGQPNYMHRFDVFKKIQASGKSLLINEVKPQDVQAILSELSSKGLFLLTRTDTQEEAEDLIESVKKWTHE